MSDEQRKDDETEVEGHIRRFANDEPSDEGEDEVEAHVRRANSRLDVMRKD
jgi:hypothetical protein